MTSNTPPIDSLALRCTLMWPTIARLASRSRQRTGSSSTPVEVGERQRRRRARGARTLPIWTTCERISTPSARRNARASAPPATRAAVSRALARSSTLRTSVKPYFCVADEVGVAGPREVHLGHVGLDRPRVHPLLPVGVVAVGDLQRDRAAERQAVAHAAGDLGAVALDLHAPATTVAQLAPGHVAVERLLVERQPGGQALDDAGEAGAVGLPGGDEAQRHGGCAVYVGATAAVAARRSGAVGGARVTSRPWSGGTDQAAAAAAVGRRCHSRAQHVAPVGWTRARIRRACRRSARPGLDRDDVER